tara:strand:+ start:315 stop:635 length:321 start_codon:yes stop_codon:yes gene_type:complete
MKVKKIVFDIDGTICDEAPTFEKCLSKPINEMIEVVNDCYNKGCFVILYTARSWSEFRMTEDWLKKNNVLYNLLLCGKPTYDLWVDDRAISACENIKHIKERIYNG